MIVFLFGLVLEMILIGLGVVLFLTGAFHLWRRVCIIRAIWKHSRQFKGHYMVRTQPRDAYHWPTVKCAVCGQTVLD